MMASAFASPERFAREVARACTGIIGSASGQSAPARGRMHCVIIPAEHAGQSVVPFRVWSRSDQ